MKKIIIVAALAMLPVSAFAANVGECGWGSKLFDKQKGIFPQILAVTTNGTSGNQTFAISSGTSGCTQNGVVRSSWKTAAFLESNRTMVARDMAAGEGENLTTLASLIGVDGSDQVAFNNITKKNFGSIFPSRDASTEDVMQSLKVALASHPDLEKYSVSL